jgi:hypothetical protein
MGISVAHAGKTPAAAAAFPELRPSLTYHRLRYPTGKSRH